MKKIITSVAFLCLTTGFSASAQFNLGKAINSGVKAVQAFTLTDAQMAEYCKESVDWMDKHNPVLPEDNEYTKRLRRLTESIFVTDGYHGR